MRLQPRRLVRRHGERDGVRLAEAVGAERLHDLPGPLNRFCVVAVGRRELGEPHLDAPLRLRVRQPAPHPVRLAASAAGHDGDDVDDLLVEDHHSVGVLQRPLQIGVRVTDRRPSVPGLDERPHHVGGDRARPEQRDVHHQVVEGLRLEPADQVALARRLDLEAAQCLGGADQPVRRRVARRQRVQVEAGARGAPHLGDRVRHRRLHPHAEHVEFEQSEVLHVVLVELRHREALAAGRHDRRTRQQGGVGQQDTAGMHGDPARQRVEGLGQLPQPAVALLLPLGLPRQRPQLGQFRERGAGVAGPDVREGLGDTVDLGGVHGQRRADVADRVAHPVRLRHRDRRHPLGAEPADDRAVDLQPAGRLHVDVDVGQHHPLLRQEALHQQPVLDRVGVGDAEEMVDERARAGTARGDPDAHVPHVVHDPGDREEVRGEAVVGDDVQLVVHPLPVGAPPGIAAAHHARRRPRGQRALRGAPAGADEVRLGEVDGADAEVVLGVDQALGGRRPGLLQQPVRGVAPETGRLDDPPRRLQHGARVLEPCLARVEFSRGVDRDQPAGGVQDVGDRALAGVGVTDGVAEHRTDPLLGGEAHGAGGQSEGAGPGSPAAVPDGLQPEGVTVDLAPGGEEACRAVRASGGERAADVGAGAEQDGQSVGVVAGPGQQRGARGRQGRGGRLRIPARRSRLPGACREAGGMGGGDQTAQIGPARRAVPGQEGDAGCGLVDEGAATHRGTAPPAPRRPGTGIGPGHREVRPEQRPYPGPGARLGEADGAREGVAVGEGEGVHAPFGGTLGQPLRVRGAVAQGVPGDGVQMRETRHARLPRS